MNQEIATLRQAIAGITQMIAGRGLRVTQEGTQAYVQKDPRTNKPTRVNIPNLPDNASPALVMAIQGFIDHECGHILDTDYAVWGEAEKFGREKPGGFGMWNILEDTFIEAAMRRRFPGAHFNLDRLHEFFVTEITQAGLDAAGTDHKKVFNYLLVPMCRAWAGQPVFVRFMADKWHLIADEVAKIGALKDQVAGLRSSAECLVLARAFHAALYPPPPPVAAKPPAAPKPPKAAKPPAPPKVAPAAPEPDPEDEGEEEAAAAGAGGAEDEDEGAPAAPPAAAAPAERDEDDLELDEEEAPEEDEADELALPSAARDDAITEDDAEAGPEDLEDDAAAAPPADELDDPLDGDDGDDEDAGGGMPPGEAPAGDWTEEDARDHLEVETDDGPSELGEDEGPGGGHDKTHGPTPLIDESVSGFSEAICERIGAEALEDTRGSEYRVFTKDGDKIEPYKVSEDFEDKFLVRLDERTRAMVSVMQKDIERMVAARSQVVRVGGYRSGRLRGGALHRLAVNDDRVFERKHTARSKNVAVSLLIDNSGSMSGSKIDVAMLAGYALSSTLERVGIKHEVVGFTTGTGHYRGYGAKAAEIEAEQKRIGRAFSRVESLWMPIFKSVEERLTPEVKRRFADFAPNGQRRNNVDGECVEIAAQRLRSRSADRRVLIVLSDGEPACYGNNWEIERHLKRAVQDAEASGIETIGIGIQDNAVRKFYPKHMVINQLEELPAKVMGELRGILAA